MKLGNLEITNTSAKAIKVFYLAFAIGIFFLSTSLQLLTAEGQFDNENLNSMFLMQATPTINIGSHQPSLSVGTTVPQGELEAVGKVGGCTATLITESLVLTAAHCVCPLDDSLTGCSNQATFTLENVFPVDDPTTSIDESQSRQNVSIDGSVRVYPEYGLRGWLRGDYAVISLNQPIWKFAPTVIPIPVESPVFTTLAGDILTLVGFGVSGTACGSPSIGKQKLSLAVSESSYEAIVFKYNGQHVCPGDSGGPVINERGKLVGIASWGNFSSESYYRPTASVYYWIMDLQLLTWGSVFWIPVEKAGINSHAKGNPWCPKGSFIVGIDLDGNRNLAPTDSPVVGQVQCATLSGAIAQEWEKIWWNPVGLTKSHNPRSWWCPEGSFIVGFDLDQRGNDSDSPIIGQVQCAGTNQYLVESGSSYWVEIGTIKSHNPSDPWCLDGGFITQFDLDQFDTNSRPDAYDAPIVGRVKCSHPIIPFIQ